MYCESNRGTNIIQGIVQADEVLPMKIQDIDNGNLCFNATWCKNETGCYLTTRLGDLCA